jgi:hypothetical protein
MEQYNASSFQYCSKIIRLSLRQIAVQSPPNSQTWRILAISRENLSKAGPLFPVSANLIELGEHREEAGGLLANTEKAPLPRLGETDR